VRNQWGRAVIGYANQTESKTFFFQRTWLNARNWGSAFCIHQMNRPFNFDVTKPIAIIDTISEVERFFSRILSDSI
jgi:hypothetical protein